MALEGVISKLSNTDKLLTKVSPDVKNSSLVISKLSFSQASILMAAKKLSQAGEHTFKQNFK